MWYQIILIIHMFTAISLILLVLVQQGKGATVGAAFGSGASQTFFGSRGSGSFLLRVTIGFAILFFTTSIGLNYLATRQVKNQVHVLTPLEQLNLQKQQSAPVPVVPPTSTPVTPEKK